MELLKLLGIVIVIAGFALKLDSILVILVAAVVTALVGGLGPVTLLETLGSTFVANRSMAIFIIVMLVTGTLERNGLREAAAALIGKFKGATSGLVIMPMAEGAIVAQGHEPNEEHVEELKGMAAGMENITWFFGQVLFVGGSGGLLVQSTLAGLGIEVELAQLAAIEIPVCIIATVVAIVFYVIKDRKMIQKYYIKVWICKGEVYGKRELVPNALVGAQKENNNRPNNAGKKGGFKKRKK